MRYKSFLVKYGEIGVKGKNRYLFEDALMKQIRIALTAVEGEFVVSKELGRIYVDADKDYDEDEVISALTKVFGIVAVCPMVRIEDKDFENLKKAVVEYMDKVYENKKITFKVDTRRADKNYPGTSETINADLGEAILNAFPEIRVDVRKPDVLLKVEIRRYINIYSLSIPGPGGMPIGTNGRAMLLLSGGIDSPVAGYMIAKRGVTVEAVYFHAPPYTSERAKQKVIDLAQIVSQYAGPINLHIVNFTDIQLYIYENCPHEELTIIMRRYMMKIAERIGRSNQDMALITGESIGQVASQTVQSLVTTNEVCTMPVFRPLIGFDKQEIVEIAEKIGSYETSIQPYEDCCTIFVAKHPVTKPDLDHIHQSEEKLSEKIDALVEEAIATKERVLCKINR
jgi:thiamine biosynthesis/tRNA modification protein thiI